MASNITKDSIEIKGDNRKTKRVFKDEDGGVSSSVVLVDESGEQAGISLNPFRIKSSEDIFEDILIELKINNAYLQEIVGEDLTDEIENR